ncbi:DUF3156 family protein [Burkholderia vietnamiensis]|uniref:DUF3156 family protein n=1 Tax=Burkholderia latens TaxID=488446 RepID=UPI001B9FFD42|nr:DUF3156 family protein [Burkholderia latens]MBR8144800.1 DUF3156 family protein [Burkholderia vietnamiensis]MBY4693018.1 DUF3156 family protein [Burkholderia latens]
MKAVLAWWRASPDARPPGYRPGTVVARVLTDLRAVRDSNGGAGAAATAVAARLPNGVHVNIAERADRQFLMHTVSVQVSAAARGPAGHGHARIVQTGWLRRTGIAATPLPGCDPAFVRAVSAIVAQPAVVDALRPLHVTGCAIAACDGRWTLAVAPFGGSEVVNRMPSFRRYVRLTGEQAAALSAACAAFETALRGILRG